MGMLLQLPSNEDPWVLQLPPNEDPQVCYYNSHPMKTHRPVLVHLPPNEDSWVCLAASCEYNSYKLPCIL